MAKHLSGVKVPHHKNTSASETVVMPAPEKVRIPLQQHMGAPCKPLVKVGDEVKVGQVIGDTDAFLSVPIHASVSGKVTAVEAFTDVNGSSCQAVVIASDGLQSVDESVVPPAVHSRDEFIAAIRKSGLVGLGGAGFPTFVKLNPKNLDEVDTLIINGAECEPYITADNREMLENGEKIIRGIELVTQYLDIKYVRIGVEDNKPKAIANLKRLVASRPDYEVVALKAKYPQGAEKVIIYETTGRTVPEGKLPADVGAIVMNVSSVAFVASYMETGMPLVTKRLTVDGTAVAAPKNVIVPIGTSFADVITFCGGYKLEPAILFMGGPMMGIAVYDDQFPVIKNNNAVLAFDQAWIDNELETPCIRCGRCVSACPFGLMPLAIESAYNEKDLDELAALKVNLCMECGCCSYVCPAKRNLVLTNKLGKKLLRDNAKR